MRYLLILLALLSAVGCATTGHQQPLPEILVDMTLQVIDNQTLEVRIVTFERFENNGVRLAQPEPIRSLKVQPGNQAGILLKSGNYRFSIYQEGSPTPIMEIPGMVSGRETTLHISPTG